MTSPCEILIVDDDIELCSLLQEYLQLEGFQVDCVHNGEQGIQSILSDAYQVVLLDIGLPKVNGLDVLKTVRQKTDIFILMLTARGDDVDKIIGLENGADDYLSKPFNYRELTARIKAVLRRKDAFQITQTTQLQIDDLLLNLDNQQVEKNSQIIDLTFAEFKVLEVLVVNSGMLIKKEVFYKEILNRHYTPDDRAIDVHISNLRKKLGAKPNGAPRFKTVRGQGYFYISD